MKLKQKLLVITSSCLLIGSLSGTIALTTSAENSKAESNEIGTIIYDTNEPAVNPSSTYTDDEINARAAKTIFLSAWIRVSGKGGPGYYQKVTSSGFQKYYIQGYFLKSYSGFVHSYSEKSFELTIGFFNDNNKLYYSDPVTGGSSHGITSIGNDTYYFEENINDPHAFKGWLAINGDKYYFGDDYKAKKNGFFKIDNKSYYFNKEGVLVKGFQVINDKVYNISDTGEILTGWNSYNTGHRFYFDEKQGGAAYTGWLKTDPAGYMYFHPQSGVMQKGVVKIDGETYVFTTNPPGKNAFRKFGWYTDTSNNYRYYFDKNNEGKAVKGTKIIDGKSYTFNNEGILQK